MKIDALLWDYDGTLVNSASKNIEITKRILARVAPRLTGTNLPSCLKDESAYHIANHQSKNWQDLYINHYGMSEPEMLEAGALWTEYQLMDTTPVELFSQLAHTIAQIDLPQGICSQNSSKNISLVLEKYNLAHKFQAIVGYDDIPKNRQKPHPFGGLQCLEQLFGTINDKTVVYIGDHEADMEFGRNIAKELHERIRVVNIAVKYSGADTKGWSLQPDFEIETPFDLITIINNGFN